MQADLDFSEDDLDDLSPARILAGDKNQTTYLRACRMFDVTPSTYFYRHVSSVEAPLQNQAIGEDGAKAIATALVTNRCVRQLNLSGTMIGLVGLGYILEMLQRNSTITDIDVSRNGLKSEGAWRISEAFSRNTTVRKLDISENEFRDDDSLFITRMLQENTTLEILKVRGNSFGENAGNYIGQMLEKTTSLKEIDLSWNHLRQRGAIELCMGLQRNTSLETLNLSWNGFGLEGCHEMGKALQVNRTLTHLDLSANRVNFDGFKLLLRGIKRNRRIKTLKIGQNPITTDGAIAILRAVADDRCRSLTYLDMSEVSVDSDFVSFLRKIQIHRDIDVKYGITLRHDDLRKGDVPVVLDTDDPVTILFECVKTKNLRLIDMLKSLDRDNTDTLSREELRRGLEVLDMPLSSRSMDILMNKLDINKDGQIDFAGGWVELLRNEDKTGGPDLLRELTVKYKEHVRRVTKLRREADVDLKHYKNYDRLEQLREAVRLRLALSNASTQT